MSTWGESDLKQGDRLWFEFPMSSKRVEKVRKIYYRASCPGYDESPPLVYASYLGLEDIVKAFIECAKQTNTNLHTRKTGKPGETGEVQKFLWLTGKNGRTALDMAIEKNHVKIAKLLLENASLESLISKRNYVGRLPVSLLSDPQHDDFIFKLLEDAKGRENDPPNSLLISIDEYSQQGSSRLYKNTTMDPHSYPLSQENNIKNSLDKLDLDQLELTPSRNTILHLVSECGDVKSVNDIVKNHCSLLYRRNYEKETPAYVAAREGHVDILAIMINHFKKENDIIEPLVTRSSDNHTALHVAIENHHVGVVFWLLKEIPQLVNCINAFSEIPSYLAAERGFHYILERVFIFCSQRDFTRLDGKSALHAAAISGSAGCTSAVVKLSKGLLYEEDIHGWTPLFYAIYHNNSLATAALLDADSSIGSRMLKNDDINTSPIHFAASQGDTETMKVLISKCPGCLEITYGNGRNILHFAIENKKTEVIKFIFCYELLTGLINKKDSDGNTPIHLFMESSLEMMEVMMDSRVNIHVLNKKDCTPLDAASTDEKRKRLLKGIVNVRSGDKQTRVFFNEYTDNTTEVEKTQREQRRKERESKKKKNAEEYEPYFKIAENTVLVATLIATATFTAAFTVPGGFDGNEGSKQGMSVLLRKSAYKAFVITNTIAFACSCSALLGHIWLQFYRLRFSDLNTQELEKKIGGRMFAMFILTGVALISMAIAFVTGIYVVLTPSLPLAIVLCVMSVLIMVVMTIFARKALIIVEGIISLTFIIIYYCRRFSRRYLTTRVRLG